MRHREKSKAVANAISMADFAKSSLVKKYELINEIATTIGADRTTVAHCYRIKTQGTPSLFQAVKDGGISIHRAFCLLKCVEATPKQPKPKPPSNRGNPDLRQVTSIAYLKRSKR